MKKQIKSFKSAFRGFCFAVKSESHMRFHLVATFSAVFTAVLFFLDFEVIGKIFSYFANNPVMLVLLILSAVISAVFVCAGPVKVKNAILGIKRKDKH